MSWKLPCLHKEYLKKSQDYLAHLIGHEGSGSLHFFLKSKGWITSISAGVGDEGLHRSSLAYILSISIRLTDLVLGKIHEIIGFIYQYIKLLREAPLQEWIFKELRDIGSMEFRFVEEQPQDDYAAELAENLLLYPPEHVIYGEYAHEVWDVEKIGFLLSLFTPENMRIDILSMSFTKSEDVQCEPWFGARYTEEDIALSMMDLWRNPPEIEGSLHLPLKNEFIPVNFTVHEAAMSTDLACGFYPRCILDEPLMKFWYKLDKTFKLPRTNTYFRINLKGAYESVRSCVLTELFVRLLKDELNEIIYQASIAKLDTSISVYGYRFELKIYGFSEKLPLLLSKILVVAKCFSPKDDRFKVIKEDVERNLRNMNMKPLNHASYSRLQVLCKSFWDVDEKLQCLADLAISELQDFIPKLLSQIYIEALCHGNLLEEEAFSISNLFRRYFSVPEIPVETRHTEYILCLASGANVVRDVCAKNKLETNSVLELYYQIEQENVEDSVKLEGVSDLFDEIVQEPLFNQLRTKEQMGYVVECGPRITYRVLGFCFCVQSSKYDPAYLQDRVDDFVDGLKDLLVCPTPFPLHGNLLVPTSTWPSEVFFLPSITKLLSMLRYMFDLAEREAEILGNIK